MQYLKKLLRFHYKIHISVIVVASKFLSSNSYSEEILSRQELGPKTLQQLILFRNADWRGDPQKRGGDQLPVLK